MFGFPQPHGLLGFLGLIIYLLSLAIFIRALLSWISPDPRNPIVQALDTITEPILQPLRQIVPRMGGIDITPMVAIILLQVVAQILLQS
jgi:YggT family protein